MRAVRLEEFGTPDTPRTVELTVPRPSPGEVLVQVAACGVCGQEVMRRAGQFDDRRGMILGHEIAGTVVAVREKVDRLRKGDRVAGLQRRSCGSCASCRAGRPVLCAHGALYGEDLDGGYAEFAVVAESSLAQIPSGVDMPTASIAACAVGTSLHALRLAGLGSRRTRPDAWRGAAASASMRWNWHARSAEPRWPRPPPRPTLTTW
jgi:D-arabinose 1-dehydrogenase-like Zn-dependent alcohol dehydrogenase